MTLVHKIAAFIRDSGVPTENWTVVLPSERMRKYLQDALVEGSSVPIFSPDILTIDKWMRSCVPFQVVDRTTLLLKLFEVHQSIEKDPEKAGFDAFFAWGEMLLNDFNDIDRYRTDAKDIFRNLASIKEIEQWSFNSTELSESQKRFMEFWDKLPDYYFALRGSLEKEGLTYPGLGFRTLSDRIDLCFRKGERERFIFAGFNALSEAERTIIKQLMNLRKAHLFIDADKYYLDRKNHEAGAFIRNYNHELKSEIPALDQLGEKDLKMELIACAQHTGQVKVMADLLDQLEPKERDETLVLVADESMVPVVVKNLPKRIGKANISMGIPLRSTAVRTLVDIVFSIQHNAKRFKVDGYYYADVLRLVKHPFIQSALNPMELDELNKLEDIINRGKGKYIFIEKQFSTGSKDLLSKDHLLLQVLKWAGQEWDTDWLLSVSSFRKIVAELYQRIDATQVFERAAIETFNRALIAFENNLVHSLPKMGLKSYRQLFDQHWSREAIAYHGNPTTGLQITGLLESRGLDFRRIICVGLNEGKLPPTNPLQTLIPIDLRKYHKLPVIRDKQGIFAHHLYRLLHHCEQFTATYSIAETPFGMYEPSRYIIQWEKELARDNKNLALVHKTYMLPNTHFPQSEDVEKTSALLNRLDELLSRSLTASKLKTYLTCPLDFYYKYVLEFGDKETVEEEIEQATFGTLIHQTLEDLYMGHTKFHGEKEVLKGEHRPIREEDIVQMQSSFRKILRSKFKEHFRREENFMSGNNFLAYEIATDLIERFLQNERQFIRNAAQPVFIEALEYQMEVEEEFEVQGRTIKVKFRGNADRIDRIGDQIRIIDYKSGKVNPEDVTLLKQGEDLLGRSIRNRKHVLQLIQYTWMYYRSKGKIAASGIYSFLDGESNFHEMSSDAMDTKELIERYPTEIQEILEELYDTSIPFSHKDQRFSYCAYCE